MTIVTDLPKRRTKKNKNTFLNIPGVGVLTTTLQEPATSKPFPAKIFSTFSHIAKVLINMMHVCICVKEYVIKQHTFYRHVSWTNSQNKGPS